MHSDNIQGLIKANIIAVMVDNDRIIISLMVLE